MSVSSQKAKADSIVGTQIGRLTILARLESNKHRRAVYSCRCICGSEVTKTSEFLKKSEEPSCGCAKLIAKPKKHGFSPREKPPAIYGRWKGMVARCTNPNNKAYKWYGGKGVSVCDRWMSFINFYTDMGNPPFSNAEIDRIDPNKGYEPDNCRWVSKKENIERARRRQHGQ